MYGTIICIRVTVNRTRFHGFQPGSKQRSGYISAAQQELISLSEQWNDALARKDMAALERFLAADFYVSAAGALRKTERRVWLKNVDEVDWNSLKYRNIKVDIYGETAVMTALIDFKVTSRWGIPISTDTQVTDVWTRRNGQWQVAARHLSAASIGNYLRLAAGFAAVWSPAR